MHIDVLATFENSTLLSALWTGNGTFVSTSNYDTGVAGGAGVQGNSSTVTGSGGGGAGVANSPAALSFPGAASQIGGPLLHDIGRGKPVFLMAQIGTAAAAGGTSVAMSFVSDDAALLASVTDIIKTPVIVTAAMTLGYRFPFKTVPAKVTERFVGLQYLVVGTFTGAATLFAGLLLGVDDHADVIGGAP